MNVPPPGAQPFSRDDFAAALENYDYQFQKGQVVRGKVFEHTSNGAYVDIGGKSPGFLPLREAALQRVEGADLPTQLPLETSLEFMVIGEQNMEGQVTLSRRELYLRDAWEALETLKEEGKTIEMEVTGFNRGGVTGEVNGLRGFIPRSHLLSQTNFETLVGRMITVSAIEVDRDRDKLVLSQREAARASLMGQLVPNSLVEGTIVNMKPYGVFVDLNGISGLLHVKQLSGKRIDSLTDLLQVGQRIKVEIVEVDEWKGRISLSTKVLEEYPGELLENFAQVMETAEERFMKKRAAEKPQEESSESSPIQGLPG